MEKIRERFYTVEEFPFLDRSRLPKSILEQIEALEGPDMQAFAHSLSAAQLDALIYDLPTIKNAQLGKRTAIVLLNRLSPRILKLIFSLYQDHCDSASVEHVGRILAQEAKNRNISSEVTAFFLLFSEEKDLFEGINERIFLESMDLAGFFSGYSIRMDSRLAFRIREKFFETADKQAFSHNFSQLAFHIKHSKTQELTNIIRRYLGEIAITDFPDGVNLAILETLGDPYLSSDWIAYTVEERNKFAQWVFLYRLKIHAVKYPRKFEVLSKYFERIISSYGWENQPVLIIDFGEIVVADLRDKPFSLFYQRKDFEYEVKNWKEKEIPPAFIRMDKDQTTARDYIIEDKESNSLQLRYEGVDFLYIEELLDIKMGLEPEFRRRKSKNK